MNDKRVLLASDDKDIAEIFVATLKKYGAEVTISRTGKQAIGVARLTPFEFVCIDTDLPGLDGVDVCLILKNDETTAHIPIYLVFGSDREEDITTGLRAGADDFLIKPLTAGELSAKIEETLLHSGSAPGIGAYSVENLQLDEHSHAVRVDSRLVDLTLTEFNILSLLIRHPGTAFRRSQIIEMLKSRKGCGYTIKDRTIDFHITRLRKKLGTGSVSIRSVYGIGYRLEVAE